MPESDSRDRRREVRLYGFYPLIVRAADSGGKRIGAHTLADNLCGSGMYFQFPHALPLGTRIFALIQVSENARIAVRGRILRIDPKPHRLSGIALHFSQTRLLPSPKRS